MDFGTAIRTCLRKYVDFSGRAARSEFWWWILAYIGGVVVATVFDVAAFRHSDALFSGIFALAVFLPTLAVTARRLHDTGRSGWWQLLWLIPILGQLVVLYWLTNPSEGPNRFGPDPLAPGAGGDATFADPPGM